MSKTITLKMPISAYRCHHDYNPPRLTYKDIRKYQAIEGAKTKPKTLHQLFK